MLKRLHINLMRRLQINPMKMISDYKGIRKNKERSKYAKE